MFKGAQLGGYLGHLLADGVGGGGRFIVRGRSRRIRLTFAGAEFLEAPAPLQVWYLLAVWWTRVNWLIAFPFEGMGDRLPYDFREVVRETISRLPVGEPIPFEAFADRLIQDGKLVWHSQDQTRAQDTLTSAIRRMAIDPLSDFGVVSRQYRTAVKHGHAWRELSAFQVTPFGRKLMESLVYPGRWVDREEADY